MSDSHLPSDAALLFQQLAEKHGAVIKEPEHSGSFDQLVQVAEVNDLSIRFVRDRGDEFLEVGFETAWFSPDLVRLVLLGGEPKDARVDLQQDVSFLIQHFGDVSRMFLPRNRSDTVRRLNKMRIEKARRMFPNFIADNG